MPKNKIINIGGINGLGEGLVNTNSEDFRALQSMIAEHASGQSEEEKMKNAFLSIRFQMESYLNRSPERIIPAGVFIEKFLRAIGIKKKDFAQYVGYGGSNFSALLKGRRKVNSDLALKLGRIFKTDPAVWLHIESKNDLIREVRGREEDYEKFSLQDLLKRAG